MSKILILLYILIIQLITKVYIKLCNKNCKIYFSYLNTDFLNFLLKILKVIVIKVDAEINHVIIQHVLFYFNHLV